MERGGYALLGLTRVDPLLFESMPWGGDRLLALTCERLRQLGWEHHLLPALWDVDRPRTCRAWRRWGWSCETQNSSSFSKRRASRCNW
ncbi:transferase 1, rSAM/selenodomain-associated [Pseudomonas aeruginosa]|nr:transferase 1, rSAM/selenodomain-associated [Pseudomonas aeruginosa]